MNKILLSTKSDETYITPLNILSTLGEFDLDPACPDNMPWKTAKRMVTKSEDGLSFNWRGCGRVWLNPPYGRNLKTWVSKFANEADRGMMLLFNRTDTWYFQEACQVCDHVIFLRGRICFCNALGEKTANSSPAGSIIMCKNEDLKFLYDWCLINDHTIMQVQR